MQIKKSSFILIVLLISLFSASQLNTAQAATKKLQKKIVRKNTKAKLTSAEINNGVPFVYQAAAGSWLNPMLADGCEEAAVIMAKMWYSGLSMNEDQKHDEIIALSQFELSRFGFYQDTSAADTATLAKEYYNIPSVLKYDITAEDLKRAVSAGNIAIITISGQRLDNPHYGNPGPPRHTIVVIGYDPSSDEFIVNDPGTRFGQRQRFSSARIKKSLQDYTSGNHGHLTDRTAMIEIAKDRISIQQ
jgi:hypothetical protein